MSTSTESTNTASTTNDKSTVLKVFRVYSYGTRHIPPKTSCIHQKPKIRKKPKEWITFEATSLEQLRSHVDSYYKLFDAGSTAILKNSTIKSKFCGCISFKTNVINIIVTYSDGKDVKIIPVIEEYIYC